MDCIETIMTRRSVRQYKPDPIDEQDLKIILDAGRMAPSAGNLQPCYFVVVKDAAVKAELKEAAFGQEQIGQAPVVVAVCVDPERSAGKYGDVGRNLFCLLDAANAAQNILLAAHALGYGSCWMGGFSGSKVKKILRLPDSFRAIALIPLGKAAEEPIIRPRRPLEEIVYYDTWGN
jgi:nitroreductase